MLRNISILSVGALLAACGGGGSSAPAATASVQANQTPTLGDFYSYKEIYTTAKADANAPVSTPYWFGSVVTGVEANGSWSETGIEESPSATHSLEHYLPGGDYDNFTKNGCTQTYQSTLIAGKREYVTGASWSTSTVASATGACNAPMVSATSSTTVLALESVTVVAGTFKTAKTSISASYKYANGGVMAEETTAWFDVDSHRPIKSDTTRTTTSPAGKVSTSDTIAELQGYAQAATGRSLLNVQRFAGGWTGSYAGPYSGSCSGQISHDGVLDASCGNGQFTLHGLVDADGNVNFSLSAGGSSGPTFSGKFDSPLSIQGTWSIPGGSAGTWQLSHL